MSKKAILIIGIILISMLIGLNIFTYINSKNISKYANESNSDTQSIILIDKLRTNINKLAQAQKLYLLTSKEEYKSKYNEELKIVYELINDIETTGTLNTNEKLEFIQVLNEYDNLSKSLTNIKEGDTISQEVENKIIQSNNAQLNILQQLDNSIDSTNQALLEKNNTITSSSQIQSLWVQLVSTIITGVGSVFAYYLKVKSTKSSNEILEKDNCTKDKNGDEIIKLHQGIVDITNEKDYYKNCMEYIMKYEKMLQKAKLIYKESTNIQEDIKKGNEIINKIEILLDEIKIKINEAEFKSEKIEDLMIEKIEDEIVALKILFEKVPIYNEIISELVNTISEKSKIEEL